MIVSHLNANSPKGMQWVDDVIIKGLQSVDATANWKIEVHGGDGETESTAGNEKDDGLTVTETSNEEDSDHDDERYGPAVYIIQKVDKSEASGQKQEGYDGDGKESKVALKFFGY